MLVKHGNVDTIGVGVTSANPRPAVSTNSVLMNTANTLSYQRKKLPAIKKTNN